MAHAAFISVAVWREMLSKIAVDLWNPTDLSDPLKSVEDDRQTTALRLTDRRRKRNQAYDLALRRHANLVVTLYQYTSICLHEHPCQ